MFKTGIHVGGHQGTIFGLQVKRRIRQNDVEAVIDRIDHLNGAGQQVNEFERCRILRIRVGENGGELSDQQPLHNRDHKARKTVRPDACRCTANPV